MELLAGDGAGANALFSCSSEDGTAARLVGSSDSKLTSLFLFSQHEFEEVRFHRNNPLYSADLALAVTGRAVRPPGPPFLCDLSDHGFVPFRLDFFAEQIGGGSC